MPHDQSGRLYSILAHNDAFLEEDRTPPASFPGKRIIVVSCMDPRLNSLLPRALGLIENEAYVIKNAGAVITHPFGGITRSVFVALYELGASEVFIIGHRWVHAHPFGSQPFAFLTKHTSTVILFSHHNNDYDRDCGMTKIDPTKTVSKMVSRGITRASLVTLQYSGTDLHNWLSGFDSVDESVLNSVDVIRNHPLCPQDVPVHGLIIDPQSGKLELCVNGYEELPVLNGGVPVGHTQWLQSIPPLHFNCPPSPTLTNVEEKIALAARRARTMTAGGGDIEPTDSPRSAAAEIEAAELKAAKEHGLEDLVLPASHTMSIGRRREMRMPAATFKNIMGIN